MRTHLAAVLRRLADRVDPPTPHTYTLTFEPNTTTSYISSTLRFNIERPGGA